jgi:hypothetical protein
MVVGKIRKFTGGLNEDGRNHMNRGMVHFCLWCFCSPRLRNQANAFTDGGGWGRTLLRRYRYLVEGTIPTSPWCGQQWPSLTIHKICRSLQWERTLPQMWPSTRVTSSVLGIPICKRRRHGCTGTSSVVPFRPFPADSSDLSPRCGQAINNMWDEGDRTGRMYGGRLGRRRPSPGCL